MGHVPRRSCLSDSASRDPIDWHQYVVPRHARVATAGDVGAPEAWLILHGYGMLAQGILHWFRAARRDGRVLIAPEALSRFYVETNGVRHVGASWMTREAREHDLDDLLGYLDHVGDAMLASRERVEVHGFSQGTAAACRWIARGSRAVDRLVCWGSTLPPDVDPVQLAARVVEGKVHYVIGRRDRRVDPASVLTDADRVRATGVPVEVHEFDGGHRIDDGVLADLQRS